MRFSSKLAAPVVVALIGATMPLLARSQSFEDLHLRSVPRGAEDAERIRAVTRQTEDFSAPERFEANPAGAATVRRRSDADAFSLPSGNISFAGELDFKVGNGLFRKLWVSSPSSTLASDGLGPIYNARGCQDCHIKDGRGRPPQKAGAVGQSMFLRLSVTAPEHAAKTEIESFLKTHGIDFSPTRPEPVYGTQLQDLSVQGIAAEGRMQITYHEQTVALSGGESARLRKPVYDITSLAYGPLQDGVMLSPRVAPPMIGLGLLEAVPAEDILSGADPEDTDGDGISGRAQIVWSDRYGAAMLGRFGWKAGKATIEEQTASAFSGDIGISNPLHPAPWGECSVAQVDCRAAPHGDDDARGTEIDDEALRLVTFYSRNLGVPERRSIGASEVLRGKQVFYETGCVDCHRPKFVTARLRDQPEQSFQLIWPYSDLLLHDMGAGLADDRPEGVAGGREWRTAPLWGIGLTRQVSGHGLLLHDGRARSLLEAILWHGGEAQPARDRVTKMPPEDRAALIRFLESL